MAKKQGELKKYNSHMLIGVAREKLDIGDAVAIDFKTGALIKAKLNQGRSNYGLRKRNQVAKGKD
uniref:Uncharacterized protein n=1 Tax=viral metagenome TaxID=1070528 RepID=A0A6M3L115_9ZZZZ